MIIAVQEDIMIITLDQKMMKNYIILDNFRLLLNFTGIIHFIYFRGQLKTLHPHHGNGKLESTHPSRTSVKSDQGFLVSSQSCMSMLTHYSVRAATTSTSGTLSDFTTDFTMANTNTNQYQFHTSDCLTYMIILLF